MGGFRAGSGGITARFAAAQAGIIRMLVGQVAELVSGAAPRGDGGPGSSTGPADAAAATAGAAAAAEGTGPPAGSAAALDAQLLLSDSSELPADPALARLLPDAYRDDPAAAAEFRRYTEESLRAGKVAAARTVLATLPERGGWIRLSAADAQAWLRALNDVRLALSVRLGVTDDFESQLGGIKPDDPRYAHVWVYQWLAYLQESLVEALA